MSLQGHYEPSPSEWVRDQVELYERTGGTEGNTLRDTGLPVIIVTTRGNKSGTDSKDAADARRTRRRVRARRLPGWRADTSCVVLQPGGGPRDR